MNVVTIYRNLDTFDRYYAQFKAIAEYIDNLYLFYTTGKPDKNWEKINFKIFYIPNLPSKSLKAFFARKQFIELVKDLKPDVFYAISDGWQQEYMRLCSEKLSKPSIIRVRGDYKTITKNLQDSIIRKMILRYIRERSFKQADLLIPISHQNRRDILNWGYIDESQISQPITNGVDTDLFKPNKKNSYPFTVAYIGRISPEKGIYILLEVMKGLKNIKFTVVGRKQMNITFPKNCTYYGRLPHEELPKIYNKADVVILPSETEGMPNVFLEAYSCNTPILTHKEVFPKELPVYGIVQENNDPLKYIESIKRIKLGEYNKINSRKYIEENFTWSQFGAKISNILKNL
jgi:glycosyltransferase involved in cell wall biosynthesis